MKQSGVVGVYLAAGKSSRMGFNKLNLPLGDQFVGSLSFKAALGSKLDSMIAVTRRGDSLDWLMPFSNRKRWSRLDCLEADHGQSASLKDGVKAAEQFGAQAVVVLLADQPFVNAKMINRLIEEYKRTSECAFIAFSHQGKPKPPVLLTRKLFPAIEELEGDQGARAIIRSMPEQGKQIELNDHLFFYDVDTKESYRNLLGNWTDFANREG